MMSILKNQARAYFLFSSYSGESTVWAREAIQGPRECLSPGAEFASHFSSMHLASERQKPKGYFC